MEFYHLRSFVVVANTGNLTLAAKQLCTTPPAISAHIKSLEDELKTPLFVRSSKGMALTEKGELLLIKAQKTLDSMLDMVNLAAENQNEIIGNFTLGINQTTVQLKVAELLTNLSENCQGISLQINHLTSGKIIEAITNATVDGGYIYGEVPPDFIGLTVKQQAITTIAPAAFEISTTDLVSELAAQPWITMGADCPFDQLLKQKLGPGIQSVAKTSDDGTRVELVKSGLGLSFCEADMASNQNQAVKILGQLDFDTELHFVVAKQRACEPVIKALLQEVRILWAIAL
ncbi:MAG: LysR family transcriptional regulator [Algicola sp.]|nr:LysR family transcriptional regulator [Algicola sp.]